MINYYFRDAYDNENCNAFQAIVEAYPDIRFFQPSPDKAPWHVQAILDEDVELNFWPHKMKGQRKPRPSVVGHIAICQIIDEAIADAAEEPFDVIEGSE